MSTEHEVSCISATFIIKNLDKEKYNIYADDEDYRIIKINGNGYSGYLAAIYDPSKIKLAISKDKVSDIATLKEWLDNNNYRPYVESNLDIDNTSDVNEIIISIQNWLSHIRSEIEIFKRNDVGEYLDENGSVINNPHKNLNKLVERESLLKNDIELLIEKNKLYWGGDLDF